MTHRRRRGLAWQLALALCMAPGIAPAAAPPVPASDKVLVQRALERGNLIYAYDQAAWHGTDDMRTKLADPQNKLGGWIVDGPAGAPEIVFFDKDPQNPKAVYVGRFDDKGLLSGAVVEGEPRPLSPERRRLVAALQAAKASLAAAKTGGCKNQPFNTVVLPPETPGGPVLVYFLTPQTDTDALPFGGHYLVEVAQDGRASRPRPFTNSCLEMPIREKGMPAPAALGITHLLDDVPTEIHVFSSIAAGLPVMVSTKGGERLWIVEGGSIRPMDPGKFK